ncbi:MAG: PqqD family protein [bacterium]|nr:PqqD family protein [bacterium]
MKKKSAKNYLDLIPERNPDIASENDENGLLVLLVENRGIFNKIAQKIFKKPRVSRIHLDEQGSYIWPLIDGGLNVMQLAERQKKQFGEAVEPLYPRFVKYMQIMESYGFIKFKQ